ncbi:MAG: type II toxin-antitoxin system MqsA family antitoxin [Candidatus Brocadiae bacterium]|nr:type II toxin-antitoxin system MqsA family antitoxin [Candidatus Brocadiia bacterium]
MKCVICKNGETHSGTATVTLERRGATVVIKEVPAQVCENCGEHYLSEDTTAHALELAEQAVQRGAEIEVLRYAAVSAGQA